tara:strand:+ start:480 stop:1778 length:1299 start_codon:yes stop_codon:yes gene_type:complete
MSDVSDAEEMNDDIGEDELVGERMSDDDPGNSSEEEEEENEEMEEEVPPEPALPMALTYSRQKFQVGKSDGPVVPGVARNYNRPIRVPDGQTLGLMKEKDGLSAWPTGEELIDRISADKIIVVRAFLKEKDEKPSYVWYITCEVVDSVGKQDNRILVQIPTSIYKELWHHIVNDEALAGSSLLEMPAANNNNVTVNPKINLFEKFEAAATPKSAEILPPKKAKEPKEDKKKAEAAPEKPPKATKDPSDFFRMAGEKATAKGGEKAEAVGSPVADKEKKEDKPPVVEEKKEDKPPVVTEEKKDEKAAKPVTKPDKKPTDKKNVDKKPTVKKEATPSAPKKESGSKTEAPKKEEAAQPARTTAAADPSSAKPASSSSSVKTERKPDGKTLLKRKRTQMTEEHEIVICDEDLKTLEFAVPTGCKAAKVTLVYSFE